MAQLPVATRQVLSEFIRDREIVIDGDRIESASHFMDFMDEPEGIALVEEATEEARRRAEVGTIGVETQAGEAGAAAFQGRSEPASATSGGTPIPINDQMNRDQVREFKERQAADTGADRTRPPSPAFIVDDRTLPPARVAQLSAEMSLFSRAIPGFRLPLTRAPPLPPTPPRQGATPRGSPVPK